MQNEMHIKLLFQQHIARVCSFSRLVFLYDFPTN